MFKISRSDNFNRIKFTKWLRSLECMKEQQQPINEAFEIADRIANGGDIEVYLRTDEIFAGRELCNIVKIQIEHPYVTECKLQVEYHELCKRGAAGDVDAAIAYCNLVVRGLINNGAFG